MVRELLSDSQRNGSLSGDPKNMCHGRSMPTRHMVPAISDFALEKYIGWPGTNTANITTPVDKVDSNCPRSRYVILYLEEISTVNNFHRPTSSEYSPSSTTVARVASWLFVLQWHPLGPGGGIPRPARPLPP